MWLIDNWLFTGPVILLLLAESVTNLPSRKHARHQPALVVLTYLLVVALAVAFAYAGRDSAEFGYGMVPAIILTQPLYFIASQFAARKSSRNDGSRPLIISAILFTVTALLGYSKNSIQLAARSDPAEESTPIRDPSLRL